jgi:hypothetical protein
MLRHDAESRRFSSLQNTVRLLALHRLFNLMSVIVVRDTWSIQHDANQAPLQAATLPAKGVEDILHNHNSGFPFYPI